MSSWLARVILLWSRGRVAIQCIKGSTPLKSKLARDFCIICVLCILGTEKCANRLETRILVCFLHGININIYMERVNEAKEKRTQSKLLLRFLCLHKRSYNPTTHAHCVLFQTWSDVMTLEDGCGDGKGCFKHPPLCRADWCDVIVTYQPWADDAVRFEMIARTAGYASVALNKGRRMVSC